MFHNSSFLQQRVPMNFWKMMQITQCDIRTILFVLFGLSIGLFPLGQSFRVVIPLVCVPFLIVLYWRDWSHSTFYAIPIRWLFFIFISSFMIQLVSSEWIAASWVSVKPNLLRGFVLVFVGMEAVRSERSLKWLIIIFSLTFLYEGLDGIWQAIEGTDYIKHSSMLDGRLTGSLGTYRVGNYMAIIAFPAMGIWSILPIKNIVLRSIIVSALLFPGLFLWIGSFTRIGYFGFFIGCYLLWLCIWTKFSWSKAIIPPAILLSLFFILGISRLSWISIIKDPRIELWTKALEVGKENFWFGTGSSTFILALQKYDMDLKSVPSMDLDHPHNIYVQFFVDGGIFGLVCYLIFLFGVTFWSLRHIRNGVQNERNGILSGTYWKMASFFWAGWIAYLSTGFGAHNFYRTWWLATAASLLGIIIGACQWGPKKA